MQFRSHAATPLSCLDAGGTTRSIATKIAFGRCAAGAAVQTRALELRDPTSIAGRVYSGGAWRDPAVHAQLVAVLGDTLGRALRDDFEWYCCRAAFFHNDAHYEGRLFGTWCIAGPELELVFPRASVRLSAAPDTITVFDPFEVHGILAPGAQHFSATEYEGIKPSLILGFELDLTPPIAAAFGIKPGATGRVISSATRIAASTGAFEP